MKVGANFTSDASLFQSGIVLMKKEFEYTVFFGLNGSEIVCAAPWSTIWSTQHVSREGYCLLMALWSMQSLAVLLRSCKLSQPRLSNSWVEVSPHSLL